ncbi:Hypothetical predicted protein [Octopus vulgaris]|uniref:Uncharacterized protein n=1 Tax=Octopus vulgaris TaxID=6645 RepID=A0AA36FBI7_OCTVU|nr:Hypothetical predicted protein [Octopus vulgaris]
MIGKTFWMSSSTTNGVLWKRDVSAVPIIVATVAAVVRCCVLKGFENTPPNNLTYTSGDCRADKSTTGPFNCYDKNMSVLDYHQRNYLAESS